MPHNFRIAIAGAAYVSNPPAGSDATATPTDPNTPRATPNNAFASTIIGNNVYKGAFTLASSSISTTYRGDGQPVLDLTANLNLTRSSGLLSSSFFNILFRMNSFSISTSLGGSAFFDCVFDTGAYSNTDVNSSSNFNRCVFKDLASSSILSTTSKTFNYCQFLNVALLNLNAAATTQTFNNNYVDEDSVIAINTYFATPATQFTNNNFRGRLRVGGVFYELKRDKAGNAINPNPGIADIIALDANVYARGNFSQDPEYLFVEKRDFVSVAPTSPNLFADSTGLLGIGNVSSAVLLKATDSGWSLTNLALSSGDFVLSSGTSGTAISPVFEIAPTAQVLKLLPVSCLLNFNTTIANGLAENNNVTATDNFASGSAGANPYFLTLEARWTDSNTAPASDSDYTNNGVGTAGAWIKFLHDVQPRVDVNNLGNGDPAFVQAGSAPIRARYMQFRVTVRNGLGPL